MCICFYLSINLSTKLLSKESDNMFYPAKSCFFIFLFLKMDCKYQYKQYRFERYYFNQSRLYSQCRNGSAEPYLFNTLHEKIKELHIKHPKLFHFLDAQL